MAFDCEVGSFVLNTSKGNQTITLDDNGITPKLLWIRSTRSTSDGNYQDDAFFSLGWGTTSKEFSCQTGSADNVGTSEVMRSIQDSILTAFDPSSLKAVVSSSAANPTVITVTGHGYSNGDRISITNHSGSTPSINAMHIISNVTTDTFTIPADLTGGGGTGGQVIVITEEFTIVSFNAGNFIISVDQAEAAITVEYKVWGGSDFEGVFIGNFNAPTSVGDFSVSDDPFSGERPSAVFFMTSQNSNGTQPPDDILVNHRESAFAFGFMGMVKQNSSQMSDCMMYSSDQEATMETFSTVGTDDRCFSQYASKSGAWALNGSFSFVSMDTDGFTLNQSAAGLPAFAYYIGYLAIKGSNWEVVEKALPTSPGTQSIVNSGFAPDGAIFTLAGGLNAAMMHGWASNDGGAKPFPEGVGYQSDKDNIATSDAKRLTRVDKCLSFAFPGSTTDLKLADLDSWNSDGLTLDFTTAGSGSFPYFVIMFGDAGTPFEGGTGTDEGMIALV